MSQLNNRISHPAIGLQFRRLLPALPACAPLARLTLPAAYKERRRAVADRPERAETALPAF
jgi:hypothetical protein